jgi:monoamine oxidase
LLYRSRTVVTRREFLTAIAAAAAPLPQIERFTRSGADQRVIVIGAGLAGLCTAYELQALGHRVTVLEAQMRPGGRVRTLREPFAPGVHVEAGAEQIPGAHELTQHYARVLGLTLLPTQTVGTRFMYYVRGRRVVNGDAAVWPFALTDEERTLGRPGLFRKYVDEDIAQARAGFPQQIVRALDALDRQTPGAWLQSRGASPAAAELITLGFGADLGSAASFVLHAVNSRGSIQSYRIDGGNDRLPRELATRVEVKYGVPVVAVRQDDRGVEVVVRAGSARDVLRADRAVCTLPCPVIGRMFDEAWLSAPKQRAIREQQYSRTVKVFLQTRTRFWLKDNWSGFAETDLPIERLTPDPGVDPGSRGALAAYPIGAYTSALEKLSEDERVAAARDQATQIFPELRTECEGGLSHCWGLDPWERGSFALHTPGQIGFLDTLAAVEGRIHFAGEHTSPWTGWMQGALESARRVVREING